MSITPQEMAAKLDGREYNREMSYEEQKQAKTDGLVVIFGRSDDLVDLLGAIDDEVGAYKGATIRLTRAGVPENKCDDTDCPYFAALLKNLPTVDVAWVDEPGKPAWRITTEIPHGRFTIVEDGEPFSDGIVIRLEDLPERG